MRASLDDTFAALADPTRRRVVDLLRREPLCSSDIADALAMSRPATSRHLRVLRKTGLVAERVDDHDARVRVYRLLRDPFVELSTWADEIAAFWGEQLQAFAARAEGRDEGLR